MESNTLKSTQWKVSKIFWVPLWNEVGMSGAARRAPQPADMMKKI